MVYSEGMTQTLQAPYLVETAKELDDLPVGSTVIVRESEFGDHVAWQKTDDVLAHKNAPAEEDTPEVAWASVYYKQEHDSVDLLTMSYEDKPKVLVVYVHPAK